MTERKQALIADIQNLLNTHEEVKITQINPALLEFMDEDTLISIIDNILSQKEKATKWFSELNDIRTKVSHPERASVTESEFKFLTRLRDWLLPNIIDEINNIPEEIEE